MHIPRLLFRVTGHSEPRPIPAVNMLTMLSAVNVADACYRPTVPFGMRYSGNHLRVHK